MAFVPKQQLPEDQENKFGLTSPTTSAPSAGGSGGSAGSAGAAPGVGSSTQFGSNAARLSDYLKANQSQVGEFGGKVAEDLTNRYNQTLQGIDQGSNQFGEQVQGGVPKPNQETLGQAFADPASFVKNQQNVQQFQGWYNPQYGGPQNFEGSDVYKNLNDQVNKATQTASLTGSQAGLGTYLNTYMGVPNYTPGMRNLDTALLQKSPQARQAIQQASSPYSNLGSYLTGATEKSNQGVAKAKQDVSKVGEDVRKQTQGVTDKLSQDLQARIGTSRDAALANDAALKTVIGRGGGTLTDQEKSMYDIGNWDELLRNKELLSQNYGQNFDLNPYLSDRNPEGAFSNENVASADDYAHEAALQQLTGNQFNLLPDDGSLAGTAPKNLSSFDDDAALRDMQAKLLGLDTSFIEDPANRNMNLGAGSEAFIGSGGTDRHGEQLPGGVLGDPKEAYRYQRMIDIYNRNPNLINPLQKGVSEQIQAWLNQMNTLGPQTQPQTQPTSGNTRYMDGEIKWFNGSEWVKAPASTRRTEKGTEEFNYNTGKYEAAPNNPGFLGTQPVVMPQPQINPGVGAPQVAPPVVPQVAPPVEEEPKKTNKNVMRAF